MHLAPEIRYKLAFQTNVINILLGRWSELVAAVEAVVAVEAAVVVAAVVAAAAVVVVVVKPWMVPCSVLYFGNSLTADGINTDNKQSMMNNSSE